VSAPGPPVETNKSDEPVELCPSALVTTGNLDKSQLRGSVCSFEQVGGDGEAEVMRVAERQRGCIHRRQALATGVGRWRIAEWLGTAWLHTLFSDVYLVGRPRIEPLGWAMAAVLHLRGDALLSHRTAGCVWGLVDEVPEDIAVTLVGRNANTSPRLRLHRVATLHPDDIACCQGLPVTSVARTAVDVAGELTPIELESVLALIARRGLASAAEIEGAIERTPYRKGVGQLREMLNAPGELARTRSDYERRLLALIREARLPAPRVNAKVGGFEVDFLWPEQRLIVEFDGFAFHGDRGAFERDRARDRRLAQLGHQVVRLTARGLDRALLATVAELATLLATRGAAAA
jgi:very-short-patch-repair endonuclease